MMVDRGYSYEVNHGARIQLSQADWRCAGECCCPSNTDETASKVAIIIIYSGTGALVGWAAGPGGAVIGAAIGCTAAVIKIIYNHFQNQNQHR